MNSIDAQTPADDAQDDFIERRVTYTLEMDGRFYLVENVPARVDARTGEELFSPETVERLHRMLHDGEAPMRFMETPVYQFAG
jgi:hypothetical protein